METHNSSYESIFENKSIIIIIILLLFMSERAKRVKRSL